MYDRDHVRRRLETKFSEHRKETLMFAGATIVMTPFALLAAIAVIFAALVYIGLDLDELALIGGPSSYLNISLVILSLSFFVGRRGTWKDSVQWVTSGFLVVLFTIVWGTLPIQETSPILFWIVYCLGFLLALACLGHAYTPRDHYYLGWLNGHIDDPFTLRDDAHRAHVSLGFAVAIPKMIFEAYGHLFGSRWLWTTPRTFAFTAAAQVLLDAEEHDNEDLRKTLKTLDPTNVVIVMSLLQGMKLIQEGRNGMSLTREGRKTVGV
ncbi:MAG: hypothetical protein P1V97_22195 [Planctomycetota bacterium]|nr:hypothetical protein [Planctomycetota bacterium]